jgi:hypothetical protein
MTIGLILSIIFIILKYAALAEPMVTWTIWQCLVPCFIELGIEIALSVAWLILVFRQD